jgi:hypothetical protein
LIPDPIDDILNAVDWDGLTVWLQPLATVLTGIFAVIAATVTYRAVKRQIDANAQNVQDQIHAAAEQQQKNREADWAVMRRKEVLDILERRAA